MSLAESKAQDDALARAEGEMRTGRWGSRVSGPDPKQHDSYMSMQVVVQFMPKKLVDGQKIELDVRGAVCFWI